MSFGGGSSGGSTTNTGVQPYAPAEPALQQIISEAGTLYNQGVGASGYVAPTQQTLTGLAQQEAMAGAANQQLADTLSGKYLNPFLSPLIQKTAGDVYGSVASQFTGAGRTPTSPLAQSQVVQQVAQQALPFQRIGFMSDIFRGVPALQQTYSTTTTPPPSRTSQLLGLGIAGLGAAGQAKGFGNLFNFGAA